MELTVKINFCEKPKSQFKVSFAHQTKIIDEENPSAVFSFDKEGIYDITFSQVKTDETFSAWQKIFFLLLSPFIGILSFISLYAEFPISLHERINPYLISQKVSLSILKTMDYPVVYQKAVYSQTTQTWSKPFFIFPADSSEFLPVITPYMESFNLGYLDFKRDYSAVIFDIGLFFTIVSFLALCRGEMRPFLAFSSLAAFVVCVWFIALSVTKRKIRNMEQEFLKTNSDGNSH